MHKRDGFTLIEVMVSVTIMGIIATIAFFSLTTSQRTDQLNTAARVVEADLRSAQSRALTAENIKTCTDNIGLKKSCEISTVGCTDACVPAPPAGIGIRFVPGKDRYTTFAEVEPSTNDWRYSGTREDVFTRVLAAAGAPNVIVSAVSGSSTADIAFKRQNGSMVIDGCDLSQGTCTPVSLTITLKHTKLNVTRTVSVNAITGRISIQ